MSKLWQLEDIFEYDGGMCGELGMPPPVRVEEPPQIVSAPRMTIPRRRAPPPPMPPYHPRMHIRPLMPPSPSAGQFVVFFKGAPDGSHNASSFRDQRSVIRRIDPTAMTNQLPQQELEPTYWQPLESQIQPPVMQQSFPFQFHTTEPERFQQPHWRQSRPSQSSLSLQQNCGTEQIQSEKSFSAKSRELQSDNPTEQVTSSDEIYYPPKSTDELGSKYIDAENGETCSESSQLSGDKTFSLFELGPQPLISELDVLVRMYWSINKSCTPAELFIGCHDDDMRMLSINIWEWYLMCKPSLKMYAFKMKIWKQLQVLLNLKRPSMNDKLSPVGSTISGLAISSSDIDLCLLTSKKEGIGSTFNSLFHLRLIKDLLEGANEITSIRLVEAKLPVLKIIVEEETVAVIRISCNTSLSIANTQLIHHLICYDWRLQPIYSIVKQWAIHQNINDPFRNTLSSYTIILMVIQFLQCGISPPVLPCLSDDMINSDWKNVTSYNLSENFEHTRWKSSNQMCLGELLMQFFTFYRDFAFYDYVLSVRLGKAIKREDYKPTIINNSQIKDALIYVEEPFSQSNTASAVRNTRAMTVIKETLKRTVLLLERTEKLASIFM